MGNAPFHIVTTHSPTGCRQSRSLRGARLEREDECSRNGGVEPNRGHHLRYPEAGARANGSWLFRPGIQAALAHRKS